MTRLAGKMALITGGGTGIGQAIALAFAHEGPHVPIAGRRKDKLEETLLVLKQSDSESLAIECDVTKAADTERAVKTAEAGLGKLNVLANNAGALSVSSVETIAQQEWNRVMTSNVQGPFLMSRAALPAMRRGGGSIVNIGSVLGIVAICDRAAYCASKGAVTMLTKAMALDHARENIRVNYRCPSIVETPLTQNLFAQTEEGGKAQQSPPRFHPPRSLRQAPGYRRPRRFPSLGRILLDDRHYDSVDGGATAY